MDQETIRRLDTIFAPETIAMVGASDAYEKWGFQVFSAIEESYPHKTVYPVNQTAAQVHGKKAYPSILAIPGPVDLAVVTVPAAYVPGVMKDCVAKGVKGAVIISGGFAETDSAGAALQNEVVRIARQGKLRIVGPNIMGTLSTSSGLNTTPFVRHVTKGRIAVASQSGNVGVMIMVYGHNEGIGFSKFVGAGNEADLTMEDFLEYFAQDRDTDAITLYIEGLRQGRRFFDLCKVITRHKPVVVIKSGRSEVGARAARSHSSALAGSDLVYDAVFRQCGVTRVETVQELLYTAASISRLPLPRSRRVGIVTVGGGIGVMAADFCRKIGIEVPPLSDRTLARISAVLPPFWSHANPVDLVSAVQATNDCLMALLDDPNIDAVVCVSTPGVQALIPERIASIPDAGQEEAVNEIEKKIDRATSGIEAVLNHMSEVGKPLMICRASPSEERFNPKVATVIRKHGGLLYPSLEIAFTALLHMSRRVEYLGRD